MIRKAFLFLRYYIFFLSTKNASKKKIENIRNRLLKNKLKNLGKYPALNNKKYNELKDLVIIDIENHRINFEKYNCYEIKREDAIIAANNKDKNLGHGLKAGLSSGTTSQNRGIFISSEEERIIYLAQILAKAFDFKELLKIRKIALCLRANNELYQSINNSRINFKFFQLNHEREKIAKEIIDYSPDVLIAPTQILLQIAKIGHINSKYIFYGAETMNRFEREYFTNEIGIMPRPIYQATEGFLGIGCKNGNIHINDESIFIEQQYLDTAHFIPIISDLLRDTQAIMRLKLDDIWQECKCDCGDKHFSIKPIEGRIHDIWKINGNTIYPNDLINKIAKKIYPANLWQISTDGEMIFYICENNDDAKIIENELLYLQLPIKRKPFDNEAFFPKLRHMKNQ